MKSSRKMTLVFLFLLIVVVLVVMLVLAQMTVTQSISFVRRDLRVDMNWIKNHRSDEAFVLVDTRSERHYGRGHPEGALNIPWRSFYGTDGKFLGEGSAEVLGKAGLTSSDEIVLAGGDDSGAVAFVFWALESLGHEKLHLLIEPLSRTRSEGIPVVKAPTRRVPTVYRPDFRPDRLAETTWMIAHHNEADVIVFDVRTRTVTESSACIPGAQSLPVPGQLWVPNNRGGQALNVFAAMVRAASPDPTKRVVLYGQSARQAATAYFVFRLMGYERLSLYEQGWPGWSADPTRPIGKLKIQPDN